MLEYSIFKRPYKVYHKKLEILYTVRRLLLLESKAVEEQEADKTALYALLVHQYSEKLVSIEKLILSLDEFLPAGVSLPESIKLLINELESTQEEVLYLHKRIIFSLKESKNRIERQIISLKLLKKGKSLYNTVSEPEYIDITR